MTMKKIALLTLLLVPKLAISAPITAPWIAPGGGVSGSSKMLAPGSTLDDKTLTEWGAAIDANATAAAAAATTANAAIPLKQKGAASGVASLDDSGNATAPVWSPQITSAPLSTGSQEPLINAGRFPVVSAIASDTDPFSTPDAFYIGGLPTEGWASSGAANNQTSRPGSLVVAGQPWGPFNAGTLESLLMAPGINAQNGVCASDWRGGAGSYCGADGVAQYIGVTNVEALIVGNVSSFTANSVVLKTALTSAQLSRLRVGMYITTNIVNDTTVPTAATDSWGNTKIANVNYYLSIINGWSADGTTLYVSGWDIPWGGSHASGQIPMQITGDAIDKINSNYGSAVVFIGNPDNGSAHNEYLDYKGYNAGDVGGSYPLAAPIVSGSSTITVEGTPGTVSGYDTNITGAGIPSNTTVTDISTVDGVSTLTLSNPTTSDEAIANHNMTIFSSGAKDGNSLARMFTGDEIDLKYWATRPNEVHLDGITIGVSADSGSPLGRTALTPDSYMLSLSGDIHNLLILDGPADGNIVEGHSFYLHGQEGVSTADDRTIQTLFGFTGEVDGNSSYNLMGWEKKDLSGTSGINGASFHLGIVDNGYANTLDPSQNGAGEIVWNHNGANVGGLSLCGASTCGLDMAASGIMTTNKQINAGGAIAMTAGNQLQFIPSDNDGYSYWYAPPSVSGLTLSAKTYQGGDASITGYNGTFSGALSATGAVSGGAATFSSVTTTGAVFGKSGVQVGNGQSLILYPSTTGTYPFLTASDASTVTMKTSAGGDASLAGIYNLTSSGAVTAKTLTGDISASTVGSQTASAIATLANGAAQVAQQNSFSSEQHFAYSTFTDPDSDVIRDAKFGQHGIAVSGGTKTDTLTVTGAASFGSLIIPFGTPASSTATCTQGQLEMDATYTYSCVAANTWHRVENGATW